MMERRETEIGLVRTVYGNIDVGPGLSWFVVKDLALPPGWNRPTTNILVLVPAGYPQTPPDNFFTDRDLGLDGGGVPGNTSPNQPHAGGMWLQFSVHVEPSDWQPHSEVYQGHNLLSFMRGVVERRLSEVS